MMPRSVVAAFVICPRGFMPLWRKGTKFGENEGFSKKLLINAGKFLLWFYKYLKFADHKRIAVNICS
jgi:hypothetical protein